MTKGINTTPNTNHTNHMTTADETGDRTADILKAQKLLINLNKRQNELKEIITQAFQELRDLHHTLETLGALYTEHNNE